MVTTLRTVIWTDVDTWFDRVLKDALTVLSWYPIHSQSLQKWRAIWIVEKQTKPPHPHPYDVRIDGVQQTSWNWQSNMHPTSCSDWCPNDCSKACMVSPVVQFSIYHPSLWLEIFLFTPPSNVAYEHFCLSMRLDSIFYFISSIPQLLECGHGILSKAVSGPFTPWLMTSRPQGLLADATNLKHCDLLLCMAPCWWLANWSVVPWPIRFLISSKSHC